MEFARGMEVLRAIKALDLDSKEAISGALNVAEHIEKASKEFYKREAEKMKGTPLGTFFSFLAKEEGMHLEKVLELKKMLKEDKISKINFSHGAPPGIHSIEAGKDETAALLYALWREKQAFEFYSGAVAKTTGTVKEFFGELAKFEMGHVALFEKYVEDLQTDNDLMLG